MKTVFSRLHAVITDFKACTPSIGFRMDPFCQGNTVGVYRDLVCVGICMVPKLTKGVLQHTSCKCCSQVLPESAKAAPNSAYQALPLQLWQGNE